MKITVKNNSTDSCIIYTDLLKARIAVDYLSMFTPYLWYLEIKAE